MNKKSPPAPRATANSLEDQALNRFNAGKYKEAIELYKKLVQNSDNSEWRRQLAGCYLQRALDFAAKGMFKDAVTLWKNYSQHTQSPYQNYPDYLWWLIRANNQTELRSCLGQLTAQQLDKEYPELAARLGLLIVTEQPDLRQALPQDSAFIAHLKIVQTALQSYRDNAPGGVDEALKQLPFRSAFRDLRTLLKAAAAIPASLAETGALLAKIPADSPYSKAAGILLACTRKGSDLAHEMEKFNDEQRSFIGEAIGLNKTQLELTAYLSHQKKPLSDKIKFNLAIQYRSLFGADLTQRYCLATLLRYPEGQNDFNKNFAAIGAFAENRLKALMYEHQDNNYDAEYYWKQCIKSLLKEGSGNAFKIAAILRHIAQRHQEPAVQNRLLAESLEYDPEDRDSYLQILGNYGLRQESFKDYEQWLAKTLEKFPQDCEVLSLAVQTASRNKSYPEAGQYALKILTIDPVNTFAKQALFASRLSQARALLQEKKFHLAESEIQRAEDMQIGKNYTLQTQLMRGLWCFAAQDKTQGLRQIAETLQKLNTDPITTHFQGAMEALLANLPVATILKELPPAKDHILSAQELARFIQLLAQYVREDSNPERLHKALEKVKSPLKKSVLAQPYLESSMLTLCQTLDSIGHFELLRHCAKRGHTEWQQPIWMYYRIYAETNGNPQQCSFIDSFRLQEHLERARREKDHRAMVLIGDYLDRYHEAHSSNRVGFSETPFDRHQQNRAEDPYDKLFGHLPDDVFYKLNKKIESLSKKTSPERLVRDLNKAGNDHKILYAMMRTPDLYSALILLKAADDLGMDIDVGVEDVLACYGV